MKFSIACICGYETPLVENKKHIDYDLLDAHQEFCGMKDESDLIAQVKRLRYIVDSIPDEVWEDMKTWESMKGVIE